MSETSRCRTCGAPIHRTILPTPEGGTAIRWVHPRGRRVLCDRLRQFKAIGAALEELRRRPMIQLPLPFADEERTTRASSEPAPAHVAALDS